MTPSLKISEKVLTRLSLLDEEHSLGKIYGILANNSVIILGLQLDADDDISNDLSWSLPAEVDVCGFFTFGSQICSDQEIKKGLNDAYVTDNPVFLNYTQETGQITASIYMNDRLEKTKYSIIKEQEILTQFLYVRLRSHVPLSCETNSESITEAFLNLRKSITSGVMVFNFTETSIYLLGGGGESGVVGIAGNPGIGELCGEPNDLSEGSTRKKKTQQAAEVDVLNVNMLKRVTRENGTKPPKNHAMLCMLDKKQSQTLSLTIAIDSQAMLNRQRKVVSLYEILVESAIRYLRLLERSILTSLDQPEGIISPPETFHFYPDECGHFITRIYQKGESDNVLLPERRQLHNLLLLPQNRPIFRRSNAYIFRNRNQGVAPLLNPHEGVKATDNGGTISLVKGKYSYYHYCQNRMDDNGWGCAYRSLQTLASWFKLQGYTEKEVPTFAEIQQCLVDLEDKPRSFVGSKQWIGSTEVNFVLNTLLGVTCKILYVSSGEEMASKGQELLSHFEVHGSPVMIGGGVLAHTILGVDYNFNSGELKFLILDPHYTGSEDLHTIQSKGWCGWKGVDFWDKSAYYNMCLPQVPVGI